MLDRFWRWLVQSSTNPTEVALTVKGVLTGVIPVILYFAPLLHIHVGPEQLQNAVGIIRDAIMITLGIVSGVMTLVGLGRKLYVTFFTV